MNILIYFGDQLCPTNGGTERCACLLANNLIHRGKIYYLACRKVNNPSAVNSEFLPDQIEAPTPNNIKAVNEIIRKHDINIIINEGGFGEVSRLFSHQYISNDVKIISHLHFDPLRGRKGYYQSLYLPISLNIHGLKNVYQRLKSPYHKYKLIRSIKSRFKNMLETSDSIVVLCPKHKDIMQKMVGTSNTDKITAILNPLTFSSPIVEFEKKKNEIIYVGRLEYTQKRVDRILKTWNIISKKNPDWHLTILGDGNDRERLENICQKLHLQRIRFAGKVTPQSFYERAKILLLTSNHEGTPMVIQEAMSYGVVPIVMNSFSAASDMITTGFNGITTKPFNIRLLSNATAEVMANCEYCKWLSSNAQKTMMNYNNNEIYKKWNTLLSRLSQI